MEKTLRPAAIRSALIDQRNVFALASNGNVYRIYQVKERRGVLIGRELATGDWFVIVAWEVRL